MTSNSKSAILWYCLKKSIFEFHVFNILSYFFSKQSEWFLMIRFEWILYQWKALEFGFQNMQKTSKYRSSLILFSSKNYYKEKGKFLSPIKNIWVLLVTRTYVLADVSPYNYVFLSSVAVESCLVVGAPCILCHNLCHNFVNVLHVMGYRGKFFQDNHSAQKSFHTLILFLICIQELSSRFGNWELRMRWSPRAVRRPLRKGLRW